MISLSSIVKAKLLTDASASPEKRVEKTDGVNESDVINLNVTSAGALQEMVLRRAAGKAKHLETEAQLRADSIVENALKNSRMIMEEAEKEGREKGYEEGYLRGLEEGEKVSRAAAEEGLSELKELIELLKEERKAVLDKNAEELMEIAFELAEKVMKQHIQTEESAIQTMLEEILLENEDALKIYLSEYQKTLDILIDKETARKLRGLMKDTKLILIQGEDLIVSESESGIVDMSIPVQMAQLRKAVDHMVWQSQEFGG